MDLNFAKYRKIYFSLAFLLVAASLFSLFAFGLKLGIEFTGGTILEIEYKEKRPSNDEIRERLQDLDLGVFYIQPSNEKGIIIRMKDIDESTHNQIISLLKQGNELEEKRMESIGPVIGRELKGRTNIVIILSLLLIVVYIALAFRRVQRPVKSWQYGIVSLITLCFDVLMCLGLFAFLGRFYNVDFTIPVVTAVLTVVGYSINNTVVVFDRIRENILKRGGYFEDIINNSVKETLSRQINTSLTTLFTVGAIYFFGGETLRYFSLALITGIISGTFSSIFLASPLILTWFNYKERKRSA